MERQRIVLIVVLYGDIMETKSYHNGPNTSMKNPKIAMIAPITIITIHQRFGITTFIIIPNARMIMPAMSSPKSCIPVTTIACCKEFRSMLY